MSLPVISGGKLIRFLSKQGFKVQRQKGSHVIVRHSDGRQTTVPLHNELDRGTLKAILVNVDELECFIQTHSK